MSKSLLSCLLASYLCLVFGHSATGAADSKTSDLGAKAQIFRDLGPHRRTITTTSADAQAYFDQGLTWMCSVYDVQKRFGRWDAILAESAPPSYMPITTATWRVARAVAYAAKKDFAHAKREYQEFKAAKASIPEDIPWGPDAAHRVLEVSDLFIAGEIALQQGAWEVASDLLEKSVAVEDTLSFREPPQWLQPVRHTLGAVYLSSGNYPEAERVYRDDLAKWPNNGWSLFGLSRALQEQGKNTEAEKVKHQYNEAWKDADAQTDTSCKCIPAP